MWSIQYFGQKWIYTYSLINHLTQFKCEIECVLWREKNMWINLIIKFRVPFKEWFACRFHSFWLIFFTLSFSCKCGLKMGDTNFFSKIPSSGDSTVRKTNGWPRNWFLGCLWWHSLHCHVILFLVISHKHL